MGGMLFGAPMPYLIGMSSHVVNYAAVQLLLALVIIFIGRRFLYQRLSGAAAPKPNMDSLVAWGVRRRSFTALRSSFC
jgi:cation transport ATPase